MHLDRLSLFLRDFILDLQPMKLALAAYGVYGVVFFFFSFSFDGGFLLVIKSH
jgi:hypothetical protein